MSPVSEAQNYALKSTYILSGLVYSSFIPHSILHNFFSAYSIPEKKQDTTNYRKAAPPLYLFHRCCRVDLPTEALTKAWSRKQSLLACKPWDKSVQQRGGNAKRLKEKSNGSETLLHVSLVPKGIWKHFITAACGRSARREEAGSQTGPKEGRKTFNILWKLY